MFEITKKGLIRKVLLIGASSKRLAQEMTENGFSNFQVIESKDMNEIVKIASSLAKSGDTVLLSPGFASFDMFKNFEVRGQAFVDAVAKL